MKRFRELSALNVASSLLAAYSALGLLIILIVGGAFYEFYAPVLGERVGAPISQTVVVGAISAILLFLVVFTTTNAAIRWNAKSPTTAETAASLLIMSEIFGTSAVVFYFTPYFFGVVPMSFMFLLSGVVGLSSYLVLHDWRLGLPDDRELRLKALVFLHEESLQFINHLVWASILFLTGAVVASVAASPRNYPPGSVKANAAFDVLMLFLIEIIYVGVGIWLGLIAPYIRRLDKVRLELRELDKKAPRIK